MLIWNVAGRHGKCVMLGGHRRPHSLIQKSGYDIDAFTDEEIMIDWPSSVQRLIVRVKD